MTYKDFIKGKKIVAVSMGAVHDLAQDVEFLRKSGAEVRVVHNRCGDFKTSDFLDADIILKSPSVPWNAKEISDAIERGVQVEMPQTLLLKLAPHITLISVMGTGAKSSVAEAIQGIFKLAFVDGGFYWLGDTSGCLSLLKKIKKDDIILTTTPHTYIEAYRQARISPHVAVITSLLPDYITEGSSESYERSVVGILDHQTYTNFVIGNDEVIDTIKTMTNSKAKMLRTNASLIPANVTLPAEATHVRESLALALRVSELFKISDDISYRIISEWKGLRGRLELIKKVNNVEYVNDASATTPYATLTALRTIARGKNIVLIMGGSSKGLDYTRLIEVLPQYVHTVILLPGSGTSTLHTKFLAMEGTISVLYANDIPQAIELAKTNVRANDCILFSPAFNSLGQGNSWKERSDIFASCVKKIR